MLFNCLECGVNFETEKSLHSHLKVHKLYLADYYCKHFPRKCLFDGLPLQFRDKETYFRSLFANRKNMESWLLKTKKDDKKPVLLEMLSWRIKEKKLQFAPPEVELFTCDLPSIKEYKDAFGSYSFAANQFGVSPMFSQKPPKDWDKIDFSKKKILIDTREQKPLKFINSVSHKLDVGDYGISGDSFDYTFVDRKSFPDFCGTLVLENYQRFRKELIRCKEQNCYLWVVIEAELSNIHSINNYAPHKANLKFIFHQMNALQHEFAGNLQFVFSGGRKESQDLIPRLLCLGKQLWNVDMQYYLGGAQ